MYLGSSHPPQPCRTSLPGGPSLLVTCWAGLRQRPSCSRRTAGFITALTCLFVFTRRVLTGEFPGTALKHTRVLDRDTWLWLHATLGTVTARHSSSKSSLEHSLKLTLQPFLLPAFINYVSGYGRRGGSSFSEVEMDVDTIEWGNWEWSSSPASCPRTQKHSFFSQTWYSNRDPLGKGSVKIQYEGKTERFLRWKAEEKKDGIRFFKATKSSSWAKVWFLSYLCQVFIWHLLAHLHWQGALFGQSILFLGSFDS